jgi:hypothetical protein
MESDSAAAKALAADIVVSAGLERPVVDILSHVVKATNSEPAPLSAKKERKASKKHRKEFRANLHSDDKSRHASSSGHAIQTYELGSVS